MIAFSYRFEKHPVTGWDVVTLACEGDDPAQNTEISFAPDRGSNLLRFVVGGQGYLYGVAVSERGPRLLGTPILYPSPNRVRDAEFSFDGRTFRFPANDRTHFLHGLVRDQAWECDEPAVGDDRIAATTRIRFTPGSAIYELFPIRNTLELTYSVRPGIVRLDFRVCNEDASQRLPFGLAIHPYFHILGGREQVRVQVPAQAWMEAEALLPTGRLVPMDQGPADLRQPTPLSELDLDDVFWGLREATPQVIWYDALGKKVMLTAPDFFSHSVVYTPPAFPFFCVENQSCSTDAHNLYARGLTDEARLTILGPGESLETWVEIQVSDL
jgi:aldose 1-epimerase